MALVILLTAILPLVSAMLLAYSLLNYASSVWLRPEVEQELERGIELYKDYVRVVKDDMKHQTDAIAGDPALREAARARDAGSMRTGARGALPPLRAAGLARRRGRRRADRGDARSRPAPRRRDRTQARRSPRPLGGGPGAGARSRRSPSIDATSRSSSAPERLTTRTRSSRRSARTSTRATSRRSRLSSASRWWPRWCSAFFLGARDHPAHQPAGDGDQPGGRRQPRRARPRHGLRRAHRACARLQPDARRDAAVARAHRVPAAHRRLAGDGAAARARDQEPADAHPARRAGVPPQVRRRRTPSSARSSTRRSRLSRRRSARCGASSATSRASRACRTRSCARRASATSCASAPSSSGTWAPSPSRGQTTLIVTHDVDVRWEVPDEPTRVAIDRQMLRRVLVNLVRNAVEAIREGRPETNGAGRTAASS